MTWQVSLSPDAARWLRKADPNVARRIRDTLRSVAELDDPRSRGRALTGRLSGLWRYDIGKRDSIYD